MIPLPAGGQGRLSAERKEMYVNGSDYLMEMVYDVAAYHVYFPEEPPQQVFETIYGQLMPTDVPDKANVAALPPMIVVATLALGLLLHFVRPIRFLARTDALWLGALLIVVSIPIVIGAARQLAKAKTAFDVRKPTTEIVTGGVFRISRNPTYLSMVLGFLGIASPLDSLRLLLLALPLMVIFQKGVIEPEERHPERKFGEKYLRYKTRVRRWI